MKRMLIFVVLSLLSSAMFAQSTNKSRGIVIPDLGWYDGTTGIIHVDMKGDFNFTTPPSRAYEYNLNNCQEMIDYIFLLQETLLRYDSISIANNIVDYEKTLKWNSTLFPERHMYSSLREQVKYIRKNNASYILLPLTYKYYQDAFFTSKGDYIPAGNHISSINVSLSISGNVYEWSYYPHMSFKQFIELISWGNIKKYIDIFNQQKEQGRTIDSLFD